MEVNTLIKKEYNNILKLWLKAFWSRFGDIAVYFQKEADQFTNPFGYHIEKSFREILQGLCEDFSWDNFNPYLENLAQIRAVQEKVPSLAANFFLDLKKVIRETLGERIISEYGIASFLELEDKINSLLLRFMDYYHQYRERLYEVRLEEWKRNQYLLLKRAGFIFNEKDNIDFAVNKKNERGDGL
ncbi:MAG: RsbRD N-terminal domain-containing protein [Caldimicrobium sp.]